MLFQYIILLNIHLNAIMLISSLNNARLYSYFTNNACRLLYNLK